MTYKKLETMHELRMWMIQVIVPGTLVGYYIFRDPQIRNAIKSKVSRVKTKLKRRFSKN